MPELFGEKTDGEGGGERKPRTNPDGRPPRAAPKDESSLAKGLKRAEEASKGVGSGSGPGGYDFPE